MVQKSEYDKKKMNPLLWFLVVIVIPGLIVLFLVAMIMTMAGVDVTGWAKEKASHIPVVSDVLSDDQEQHDKQAGAKLREKVDKQDDKIDSLNGEISILESNITELKQRNAKLKDNKISKEDDAGDESSKQDGPDAVGDIASSFSDMDNEQAARVLQAMEQDLAVSILQELSNDARGDIFDAMDADYAATLTKRFVN
ncbi:hypothetical protein GCM10028778_03430 [Barrientosiimonas marina]|uniref:MotE family protein n=1 Tax=Lentibacillus kimchii TaxID=1542911 RepID=A0ABW2UUM4_9BACI